MQKSSERTLCNGSVTVLYGSDEFPVTGSTGGVGFKFRGQHGGSREYCVSLCALLGFRSTSLCSYLLN